MTISIRSISTGSDNGTTASVSVVTSESPLSTQVGHVLILVHGNDFYAASNMPTPTVSPGSPTVTAITNGAADGGTNLAHLKSYTVLPNTAGAQTGSVTETGSHDEEKSMFAVVLAGVDTSNIIDVAANSSGGSSTSHVAPAVTTSTSDAFLICIAHSGGGAAAASYTAPGSMSNKTEIHVGGLSAVLATEQLSASGSTGTRTFTAASSVPWAAITIAVRTAAAATATFPPSRQVRRRLALPRLARPRAVVPPKTQVIVPPAFPSQAARPSHRLRGLLPRRGHVATPVPPQIAVLAPKLVQPTTHSRLRFGRLWRGRASTPVPVQAAPVAPTFVPQMTRPRVKAALARRRPAQATPPEQPGVWQGLRARLKFPKPARGRQAQPVPPQITLTPPTYAPQALRARVRSLRLFRGRTVQPVPPQITVTPPAYVPQGLRARVRSFRLFRGRAAAPVPPQVTVTPPAYVPGRARQAVLRQATVRRGHAVSPPVPQAPAPLVTRIKLRMARIFRGKVRPVVPPQIILIPPPYPPQAVRAKQKLFGLRRHRAGVDAAMIAGVHVCETPRPNTGTTARPNSGTTAYNTTTTARPNTGTTARPFTGITEDPC